MKLERLTERVWICPYEEARDRPNLGYIRGNRWSLAVDAGHSRDHIESFYRALEDAGLPLPALTVLTHWHWDHTFAMHAAAGLCLASARTNVRLADIHDRITREGAAPFLALHESIRREYAGNRAVVVTLADLVYTGEMLLDAGSCPIRVLQAESPHTDDTTLVHAAGEGVLFLGDAAYGAFPTGTKNPDLCLKLSRTLAGIDANTCVGGHEAPMSKQAVLKDLLRGD